MQILFKCYYRARKILNIEWPYLDHLYSQDQNTFYFRTDVFLPRICVRSTKSSTNGPTSPLFWKFKSNEWMHEWIGLVNEKVDTSECSCWVGVWVCVYRKQVMRTRLREFQIWQLTNRFVFSLLILEGLMKISTILTSTWSVMSSLLT